MKTNFELSKKDIISILAEKFNVKPKDVKLEVKCIPGDRPWESSYETTSAVVTTHTIGAK